MADNVLTDDQVIRLTETLKNSISSSIASGFQNIKPSGKDRSPGKTNIPDIDTSKLQLSFNKLGTGIGAIVSQINSNTMNLAEAGALTNRAIDSLADIIPGSGTVSNLIKGSFKTFGNGLELLTGFVQQNVEAFRMLSKVGADFSGNLGEIQRQSALAGMSLENYTQFIGRNSQALARLGVGVSDGATDFGNLSRQIRDMEVFEQLSRLGMSFEEINEFTIDNLALTRRSALIRAREQGERTTVEQQQALIMRDFAKNLRVVSSLTGKQASEIQADIAARSSDSAALASVRLMEMQGSKNAEENFKLLSSEIALAPKFFKQAFNEITANSVIANKETAQIVAAIPGLEEKMQGARQALLDGDKERAQQLTKEAMAVQQDFMASEEGLRLIKLRDFSDTASVLASEFDESQVMIDKLFEINSENLKKQNKSQVSFIELLDMMNNRMQTLMKNAKDPTDPDRTGGAIDMVVQTERLAQETFSQIRLALVKEFEDAKVDQIMGNLGVSIDAVRQQITAEGTLDENFITDLQNKLSAQFGELGEKLKGGDLFKGFFGTPEIIPVKKMDEELIAKMIKLRNENPEMSDKDLVSKLTSEQQERLEVIPKEFKFTKENLKTLMQGVQKHPLHLAPRALFKTDATGEEAIGLMKEELEIIKNDILEIPRLMLDSLKKELLDPFRNLLPSVLGDLFSSTDTNTNVYSKLNDQSHLNNQSQLDDKIFQDKMSTVMVQPVEQSRSIAKPEDKISTVSVQPEEKLKSLAKPEDKMSTTVVSSLENLSASVSRLDSTISTSKVTALNDAEQDAQRNTPVAQVYNGQTRDKQSLSDDKLDQIINILTDGNRLAKNSILQMKNNGQGMIVS